MYYISILVFSLANGVRCILSNEMKHVLEFSVCSDYHTVHSFLRMPGM